MQSIRFIALTAVGIVLAGATLVFAATVGLAIVGIAAMTMLASWVAVRLQPTPARATVNARRRNARPEPRVWNDGRGKIIDL